MYAQPSDKVCNYDRFLTYGMLRNLELRQAIMEEVYEDHMIDFAVSEQVRDLQLATDSYIELEHVRCQVKHLRNLLNLPTKAQESRHEQEAPVY